MTNKTFFESANNKFFGKVLIEDKEEELKHISKSSLFHNIVLLHDELKEMQEERDTISNEYDKLYEENKNLELLISKYKDKSKK